MSGQVRPAFIRRLVVMLCVVVGILAAFGTRVTYLEIEYQRFERGNITLQEAFFIPSPDVLTVMSLGRPSFMADVLFIKCFAYFIDHLFYDRIFEWLTVYIDTILALDPNNPDAYRWAAEIVKYGQEITNATLELSNKYAKQGLQYYPNEWRLYLTIGFNLYFEWNYKDEAEKKALRDEAITYFTTASLLPGTELDPNFVVSLYFTKNDKQMAVLYATQMYMEASDEERVQLEAKLKEAEADALAESLKEEQASWKKDYPFMNSGLFTLVGGKIGRVVKKNWAAMEIIDTFEVDDE